MPDMLQRLRIEALVLKPQSVAVAAALELVGNDEAEGFADEGAGHDTFGKAAGPKVNGIDGAESLPQRGNGTLIIGDLAEVGIGVKVERQTHLVQVRAAPSSEAPAELVSDKGYHSRDTLKALDDGPWKTRIAEPKRDGFLRWYGDDAARRAVVNNRTRLLSGVARAAFKLRAEIVKWGFALILDRGGMRRVWLRFRENLHKRYLLHVAGYNLGLIMRLLTGAGTPRECAARAFTWVGTILMPDRGLTAVLLLVVGDEIAVLVVSIQADLLD